MENQKEEIRQSKAIEELSILLKRNEPILFAGAGCSNIAGFPTWNQLIIDMSNRLVPHLNIEINDNSDLLDIADKIKKELFDNGHKNRYLEYISNIFQRRLPNHSPVHLDLVNLGFCGIITTNYDAVLETAIDASFGTDDLPWNCKPIDMCIETKRSTVQSFLKSLLPGNSLNNVLHLHGYYENYESLILTQSDYKHYYEDKKIYDSNNILIDKDPTFHKIVIQSLLCTKTLVFVGFSLKDPYFLNILDYINKKFSLEGETNHFAIVHYIDFPNVDMKLEKEDYYNRVKEFLLRKGIQPIFYSVPNPGESIDGISHNNIENIIKVLKIS